MTDLYSAAKVIQLTKHIREYLSGSDPKALEQLDSAIAAHEDEHGKPSRFHEHRSYHAVSARDDTCVCGAGFMEHYNGRCPREGG